MTTQEVKRKLTAILAADVVSYSRLMSIDESGTLAALRAHRRELIDPKIAEHHGRTVKTTGDGMLVEFPSVVEAVQCAVEVQRAMIPRNAAISPDRVMSFRVGIHQGDVVVEEGDIFGDGVNIVARLVELAEPGGLCISERVHEDIAGKLILDCLDLGNKYLKNIARPVRVYKVQIEPEVAPSRPSIEVASREKMAFPMPDKPSIAVLPFVNMSRDPDQEFFSDGMTEEIITALSKSPYLFVIARQSTFAYKGKPVKVKEVSEELGVRYVLEGSVRRSGEKVRITAQLIDAMTGYHLWAERYDRDLKEIFALQDEIAFKIMKTVHEKLQAGDFARLYARGARNIEAFLKAMEGREHFYHANKEDNAVARRLYEEAIALDPNYSLPYANLAWTYMADLWFGTSKSLMEPLGRAIELGQKAVALDESEALGHVSLGYFYTFARQFDMAVAHAERGLDLDPNSFSILHNSASTLAYSGKPEKAIPLLQKAIRLNPLAPGFCFHNLGLAYCMVGQFDEAIEQEKKAVEREPKNQFINIGLAVACILAGREAEARSVAAEVLNINPTFSVEQFARILPYRDRSFIDRTIDSLRKAGLK